MITWYLNKEMTEKEEWYVDQGAYTSGARALSCPSRCQKLDKIFFAIFCGWDTARVFANAIIRWPKRVNHKSVYQNTNQFSKTQISLPKHKTISQNTNQFRRNTNQFTKTQINFSKHKPISSKHKSKDWALALLLSESLERTHSQDFPRPTWRLQMCCR